MTRSDELESPDQTPTREATDLPEALENALYELFFEAPREQRAARFEQLVAANPTRSEALLQARDALARSDDMLGHLRSGLADASTDGQKIGPFEVLQVLGEGGFGTVYLAQQHQPVRRQVALKVLRQGHAGARSRRRFEAERQLLARLQHPNIAQVYDAGATSAQQHYFAMEYVDGKPITQWCAHAEPDIKARLLVFLRVCAAVQHAHQREIVHRDLKPSNVLVHDQDGKPVPKVIDFGIAKLLAARNEPATDDPRAAEIAPSEPTRVGAQVGTPGYMSPEQAAGEWIDTRTDVYSLGVLLCELLTGEQPLPREKLRTSSFVALAKTLAEEPPRRPSNIVGRSGRGGRRLHEQLREDLDWIVLKAVAQRRDDRYASVAALADDIERHLDCEPVLARQNAAGYVLRKFARRHRVGVAIASVAAITLLAVLFALIWGLRAVNTARQEAERGRNLAESRGAAARMAVAQMALDSGDVETLSERLRSVPVERRHWGWRHLASHVDHSLISLPVDVDYLEVLWLDESRVLAFPREGDIACWNVDTGELEHTFAGWNAIFREVAVARQRGIALVAGQRDISLWRMATGKRMRNVHRVPSETLAIAWSKDCTLAAIGGKGGWLDLVPIRLGAADPERGNVGGKASQKAGKQTGPRTSHAVSGKVRHRFDDDVSAIAFHGDNELVLGFERGEVRRVDIATGETLALMRGHTDSIDHLLLDAERSRIYTASVDTTVRAWDLSNGALRAKRATWARVRRLALEPSGETLFLCGGWVDSRLEAVHANTFELAGRYNGHRLGVRSVAVSPDHRRIATTSRDKTLRVWPIAPPQTSSKLAPGRDARVLAASRDGSRFAAASVDGHITVWNARTLNAELELKTRQYWTGCELHADRVYVVGQTVQARRIADGQILAEGPTNGRQIEGMLAIPETNRLIGCHGAHVLVWRLSDLELLHENEISPKAGRIAWDANSQRPLLGDTNGVLRILDATDGTIVDSRKPFEQTAWSVALACRDDLLVFGVGNSLRFKRTGQSAQVVTAHHTSAGISPDTRRVVTGGPDHKVRLWDANTGDQLLVLGGMPYNVSGVRFVDGGRRVVALSHRWYAPCEIHVWTAPDNVAIDR
ncbi:MAG: protein kinase [Planctomycetota bacterium]